MAELPNLGKHCAVDVCHQLDFLPFTCDGCSNIFCSEHRTKDSHSCSREEIAARDSEYTGTRGYTCSLEGCSNRELTRIECSKCLQSFCLSHRHAQDHKCPKYVEEANHVPGSKTAQHVNQILAARPVVGTKKPRGPKARATAAKVALMKMKMHAQGDKGCPEVDRVYLSVQPPLDTHKPAVSLFFSKTWSVGRTIDAIADRLKLPNNNNVQNAKKLRLFTIDDGQLLSTESPLSTHVDQQLICSGSTVILEYVANDCTSLNNISQYTIT